MNEKEISNAVFEIERLQELARECNTATQVLVSEKLKLSQYSLQVQGRVSEAEQSSMKLEDLISQMPADVHSLFVEQRQRCSYNESKLRFIQAHKTYRSLKQTKADASVVWDNLNSKLSKLQTLHQALEQEELVINQLRAKEIAQKKEDDTRYEQIMNKLHDISETYKRIRQNNKEKKAILIQSQSTLFTTQSKLAELEHSYSLLEKDRQQAEDVKSSLSQRKASLELQEEAVLLEEQNLQKLQQEAIRLKEEERMIFSQIQEKTIEVDTKKQEIQRALIKLEQDCLIIENAANGICEEYASDEDQ